MFCNVSSQMALDLPCLNNFLGIRSKLFHTTLYLIMIIWFSTNSNMCFKQYMYMINNNCEYSERFKVYCLGHNKVNVHQTDYDKV